MPQLINPSNFRSSNHWLIPVLLAIALLFSACATEQTGKSKGARPMFQEKTEQVGSTPGEAAGEKEEKGREQSSSQEPSFESLKSYRPGQTIVGKAGEIGKGFI